MDKAAAEMIEKLIVEGEGDFEPKGILGDMNEET